MNKLINTIFGSVFIALLLPGFSALANEGGAWGVPSETGRELERHCVGIKGKWRKTRILITGEGYYEEFLKDQKIQVKVEKIPDTSFEAGGTPALITDLVECQPQDFKSVLDMKLLRDRLSALEKAQSKWEGLRDDLNRCAFTQCYAFKSLQASFKKAEEALGRARADYTSAHEEGTKWAADWTRMCGAWQGRLVFKGRKLPDQLVNYTKATGSSMSLFQTYQRIPNSLSVRTVLHQGFVPKVWRCLDYIE